MNAEIEKGRTTTKIVKGMAELKIVAHEYLLHPTDRSLMQWKSTYDYLTKSLMKKQMDLKVRLKNSFRQNIEEYYTI